MERRSLLRAPAEAAAVAKWLLVVAFLIGPGEQPTFWFAVRYANEEKCRRAERAWLGQEEIVVVYLEGCREVKE